jgi:hypothetical protein
LDWVLVAGVFGAGLTGDDGSNSSSSSRLYRCCDRPISLNLEAGSLDSAEAECIGDLGTFCIACERKNASTGACLLRGDLAGIEQHDWCIVFIRELVAVVAIGLLGSHCVGIAGFATEEVEHWLGALELGQVGCPCGRRKQTLAKSIEAPLGLHVTLLSVLLKRQQSQRREASGSAELLGHRVRLSVEYLD